MGFSIVLPRSVTVSPFAVDPFAISNYDFAAFVTETEYVTEAERFVWGDELTPGGRHMTNIWQGTFPTRNTEADGYSGTAPVNSFSPNGFGLHNVAGNVWEWCADWFSPDWHLPETPETRSDPTGPRHGARRVNRGGSYLCHYSYCNRYRVAARSSNTPDSGTGNLGFRVGIG